jgi:hypothetical protein
VGARGQAPNPRAPGRTNTYTTTWERDAPLTSGLRGTRAARGHSPRCSCGGTARAARWPSPADGTAHTAPVPKESRDPGGGGPATPPGLNPNPSGACGRSRVHEGEVQHEVPLIPPTPPGSAWVPPPLDDNEEVEVGALVAEVAVPTRRRGVALCTPRGGGNPESSQKESRHARPPTPSGWHPERSEYGPSTWTGRRGEGGMGGNASSKPPRPTAWGCYS